MRVSCKCCAHLPRGARNKGCYFWTPLYDAKSFYLPLDININMIADYHYLIDNLKNPFYVTSSRRLPANKGEGIITIGARGEIFLTIAWTSNLSHVECVMYAEKLPQSYNLF
jgi:hypothetical protein